ncbi:MAG: YihY/virulence factor BrkB family protein [Actinobacteria bacterium]|nr:YihY/virulence factor BrkB family protein [Actinomycetota bacterium]MBV8480183.1 YihY/virulence factor BrkB family protein [Actinomycetota bacterium]
MPRRRSSKQSWRELVRLWVRLFAKDNLLTYASAIAFQALVALVALLLLTVAVLGKIGREDVWTNQVAPKIESKVLFDVFAGINETFEKIFHTSSVGLIVFAAVLTVWEISGVVRACMGALSQVYGHDEDRPWWIRLPISIGISIAFTAALLGAILLGTAASSAVHGGWGLPFSVGRWLLAAALIGLAFGLLVRYAPAEQRATRWASAGATLVVLGWIAQSLIFAEYLRIANYTSAAGSLLGVYFLTTYLYVGAIVLLVGIELDELLRRDLQGQDERGILALVRDAL